GPLVDYGVHAFFVQLRSLEDHAPLPGRLLGDIGPKAGFNSVDNGFARFDRVRLPRDALLGGIAAVGADGRYRRVPGGEKRVYGAMLHVRATLVAGAALSLARAVTVAVRYSVVRAQGFLGDGAGGSPGLPDPAAGAAAAGGLGLRLALPGGRLRGSYERYLADPEGEAPALPGLHAASAGLKALVTGALHAGIETCRRMCGGHGYAQSSGLWELHNDTLAFVTLEGTQQVLEPQTARHLLRARAAARKGKPVEDPLARYLATAAAAA
ncbi:unnamed protein product, partial [Heterosigma akashiwo]